LGLRTVLLDERFELHTHNPLWINPAGAAAAVVVVVACWPLDLLGASGPTLNQMLVVKAAYCGLLGFAVAR